MTKVKLIIGLLFCAMQAFSQSVYVSDKVNISFFSEARIENIEATSTKGNAAINIVTKDVAFKVPITSFSFAKKLMEEHFNENYMESDKFPYATLKGKILENVDITKEGKYNVTVDGTLEVHGITKAKKFTGVIENKAGKLYIDSEFMLPVADHEIKIPNDKLSNISQTIKVNVHAEFIPKK
ncbi:MAG: YceI family protein [Chitinophagaceae bacterium]|nr:YceI family protein [Chitinophagaceae bacterium]